MMDPALDFILAQTKKNVGFLVLHRAISQEDGDQIIQTLDHSQSGSALKPPTDSPSISEKAVIHHSGGPPLFTARALWGFNAEKGTSDLSFQSGDIIEVITLTNSDWWYGRCGENQGLFPVSYVEKLPVAGSPNRPSPMPQTNMALALQYNQSPHPPPTFLAPGPYSYPAAPPYTSPPYHPGYPGVYTQPQQHQGYIAPQPGPNISSQGQPPPPPPPPKHHKFGGKLGSTLVQSAAGGVGFGAGSAIGSGIIHSIF